MPPAPKRTRRWIRYSLWTMLVTIAFTAAIAWLWSRYLDDKRWQTIPWQPFSRIAMRQHHSQGHDVLVSFTANWDVVQKMLEHSIDKPDVRRALRTREAVPMRMDCTPFGPDVQAELAALGRQTPPLIVIYPATGGRPIVFDFDNASASIAENVVESLGHP
jgi:thiol:disulfide interchange protein